MSNLPGVKAETNKLKIKRANGLGYWHEHISYMQQTANTNETGVCGLQMTDRKDAFRLSQSIRNQIKKGTLPGYVCRQQEDWIYLIRMKAVQK